MKNKTFTVVIEKRHCEGRNYGSNDDCPMCAAIREQLPDFKLKSVGGDYARDVTGRHYYFKTAMTLHLPGDKWNSTEVDKLRKGEIDKVTVVFSEKKLNSGQEVQECDATKMPIEPEVGKTKYVVVKVSESIYDQVKELVMS